MLALPVAVIGYGFVEQRFVGAEYEPLIIEDSSVNKILWHWVDGRAPRVGYEPG